MLRPTRAGGSSEPNRLARDPADRAGQQEGAAVQRPGMLQEGLYWPGVGMVAAAFGLGSWFPLVQLGNCLCCGFGWGPALILAYMMQRAQYRVTGGTVFTGAMAGILLGCLMALPGCIAMAWFQNPADLVAQMERQGMGPIDPAFREFMQKPHAFVVIGLATGLAYAIGSAVSAAVGALIAGLIWHNDVPPVLYPPGSGPWPPPGMPGAPPPGAGLPPGTEPHAGPPAPPPAPPAPPPA